LITLAPDGAFSKIVGPFCDKHVKRIIIIEFPSQTWNAYLLFSGPFKKLASSILQTIASPPFLAFH
jgi:hypothetical protein